MNSTTSFPGLAAETNYPGPLEVGSKGKPVRRLQEWLCLRGSNTAIDEDFGPATKAALEKWVKIALPTESGKGFTPNVWEFLVRPMVQAFQPLGGTYVNLRSAIVDACRSHLRFRPREVGGDNRGPWVRAYMDGNDGSEWKWCAGFALSMVKQACVAAKVDPKTLPFKFSYSCDEIATSARDKKVLVSGDNVARRSDVRAGDLFLVRRTPTDWIHVGVVMPPPSADLFHTAEGNTNDDGSANGFEATERTRGWSSKDFVLLAR